MDSFQLKSGRTLKIEAWNNSQLHSYVSSRDAPTEVVGDNFPRFTDFEFLGPETAYRWNENEQKRRMQSGTTHEKQYSEETRLSPLEQQAEKLRNNEEYDRSIVALDGDELVGIIPCHWRKSNTGNFWRYSRQYVDVRKDSKHQGVATAMLRALDQSKFLEGKILQTGMYWTDEGRDYLRKASERELKAEKYALIPDEYWLAAPPAECGVYDSFGKRAESASPAPKKRFLRWR